MAKLYSTTPGPQKHKFLMYKPMNPISNTVTAANNLAHPDLAKDIVNHDNRWREIISRRSRKAARMLKRMRKERG